MARQTKAAAKETQSEAVLQESGFSDAVVAESVPIEAVESGGVMDDGDLQELERMASSADMVGADDTEGGCGNSQSNSVDGADACAFLLSTAFGLVALSRGEHWALAESEAETLGDPLNRTLEKYFPNFTDKIGCEVALVLSLVTIAAPRLAVDASNAREQAKDKPEDAQQAHPTQSPPTGWEGGAGFDDAAS